MSRKKRASTGAQRPVEAISCRKAASIYNDSREPRQASFIASQSIQFTLIIGRLRTMVNLSLYGPLSPRLAAPLACLDLSEAERYNETRVRRR